MSTAQHKSTNRTIFGLAFFIALLILVNGAFAYWQMQQVKDEFYEVANRDLPLAAELLPLIDRQFEQTLLIEKLHKVADEHKRQVIHILEESFIRTGDKFNATSESLTQMLEAMLYSPREATRQKMVTVEKLLDQIISEHNQYQEQVLVMIKHMKTSESAYSDQIMEILAEEEKDLTKELISLRDQLQAFTQSSAHAVEQHEALVIKAVVVFTLFIFSLGAMMLLMMRQVMNSREKAVEQISFYASYDPLTEVYNRRHFFEELSKSIDKSIKHQRPLSLCVCDIDHFKGVNDQQGHQFGDAVLEAFADIVKTNIRTDDFVGRFGGDEFVICFPDTSSEEAAAVVERVRERFASKVFKTGSDELRVSSTFGVAELDQDNPIHDYLMECADQALYQAKDMGRNRVFHVK